MSEEQIPNITDHWHSLEGLYTDYALASARWHTRLESFSTNDVSRVAIVRYGLWHGGSAVAFHVAEYLNIAARMELLAEWIPYAIYACGEMEAARKLLKSLPIHRLLQEIEAAAEPLLLNGTADTYSGLLDLYADIDAREAFSRLVQRALESRDVDTHYVGELGMKDLSRFGSIGAK